MTSSRPRALAKRALILVVAAGASLALVACGGDSDGPVETVEEFVQATIDMDGEAACALVSAESLDGEEEACIEGFGGALELTDEDIQKAEDTTYEVTEETDEAATVTANGPDGEETIELVKEDGEWRIQF